MSDIKLYNKANSILELRQQDRNYDDIHARIRALCARLDNEFSDDYHTQIIRYACIDLLGEAQTDTTPQFVLRDHVVEEIRRLADDDLPRYLFYRYRYDMFPQQQSLDTFPPCLQIEPSSICNYRCVFCYQTDTELTRPKNSHMGTMSLELFKQVIDQAEGNCEAVTLASRGEPLICKEIEAMLAYVRGKFLALKINTNASFLDERKAHALLQSGVNTLVFSADAAVEPLYSQLRVNGKLDKVLANIQQFQQIRARHYPDTKLITRVSGVRISESQNLDEMERFWGGLVDQVAFVDYNPWENTYQRPLSEVTLPCTDLWRRTFVWFDGTVNPCDVDYLSTLAVGNVNSATLSDIWTGEQYAALRTAHFARRRGAVSPCNRCTLV